LRHSASSAKPCGTKGIADYARTATSVISSAGEAAP
jgi:hypothetical protein